MVNEEASPRVSLALNPVAVGSIEEPGPVPMVTFIVGVVLMTTGNVVYEKTSPANAPDVATLNIV